MRQGAWQWSQKPPLGTPLDPDWAAAYQIAGFWTFNEGCGTYLNDVSVNRNKGTYTGAASPQTQWQAGDKGPVLGFTAASSQYVTMGNIAVANPLLSSLWIRCRFKVTGTGSTVQFLFGKGNTTSTVDGFSCFIQSNLLYIRLCDASSHTANVSISFADTTKYHVLDMVIDRSAGLLVGYLDGSNHGWGTSASLASVGTITTTSNFYCGQNGGSYLGGQVDFLSIAKINPSAGLIAELYANPWQGFAAPKTSQFVPVNIGSGITLAASPGSFALTGNALTPAILIPGNVGTFAETGEAAAIGPGINATAGSFALAGQSAGTGVTLPVSPGSFSETGMAVAPGVSITSGAGVFSLTGEPVTFSGNVTMSCGAGTFSLSGEIATLTLTVPSSVVLDSVSALLPSVLNTLQTKFAIGNSLMVLNSSNSSVELNGQPPPFAGQLYVVVHPGPFRNLDSNPLSLSEVYDFYVTVTVRTGVYPQDRLGVNIVTDSPGLYAYAEAIRATLHGDYSAINTANALMGDTVNGFVDPLRFGNCSAPVPQGPDWFWATGHDDAHTGVSLVLSFPDSANRLQTIESQA